MTVNEAMTGLMEAMTFYGCKSISFKVDREGEPTYRVVMAGKPGKGMDVRDFYDVKLRARGEDAPTHPSDKE